MAGESVGMLYDAPPSSPLVAGKDATTQPVLSSPQHVHDKDPCGNDTAICAHTSVDAGRQWMPFFFSRAVHPALDCLLMRASSR